YDNAEGKRRTLGNSQTGGRVAVPIFGEIVEATWANYARKMPLYQPSPEARKELVAMQIDLNSGTPLADRGPGAEGFTEYFRVRRGRVEETQYSLVPQNEVATNGVGDDEAYLRDPYAGERGYTVGSPFGGGSYYTQRPNPGDFFQGGGLFGGLFGQPQRQVYP